MARNSEKSTTVSAVSIEEAIVEWGRRRALSDFYHGRWYVCHSAPSRFQFFRNFLPAFNNSCDGAIWKMTQKESTNHFVEYIT